eukprot:3046682-Rhodomonas_salina.1
MIQVVFRPSPNISESESDFPGRNSYPGYTGTSDSPADVMTLIRSLWRAPAPGSATVAHCDRGSLTESVRTCQWVAAASRCRLPSPSTSRLVNLNLMSRRVCIDRGQ